MASQASDCGTWKGAWTTSLVGIGPGWGTSYGWCAVLYQFSINSDMSLLIVPISGEELRWPISFWLGEVKEDLNMDDDLS